MMHEYQQFPSTKCFTALADRPSDLSLNGHIRVRAEGLESARTFLIGNPVYEAGGTVEIHELLAED